MSRPFRQVIEKESTGRRIIEQSRIRLLCVGLFFLLCFCSICVRMVDVAILHNTQPATITVSDPDNEEKNEQVEIKPNGLLLQRGDIADRNGVLLATSLMTTSVFANPKEIRNPEEAAKKIASVSGLEYGMLLKRLKSGKSFVWIKRNLTPKEEDQINALGIPGLYFQPEERRVYPYGNLLAHVLGYVGIDNKGLAGIEKHFDTRLRDTGSNHDALQLAIDVRLQAIMHEEIKRSMEEFRGIGAVGIISDVRTGELLSMVSLPDFDPNMPAKSPDDARFNRASLGSYEMGSTFKSFTMAMAMEYGIANMKSQYDATNAFKIATFTISDAHGKKRWLTMPEIYAYSSNIGTAKMALDVGTKRQKIFLEKMGMMKPVDIELPEKGQPLYPADWKEINTVTISYGHGMAVSPLHLVRGIATLVNGGALTRLTLVKDGNKNKATGDTVVAEQTAKNIRRLMRLVVDHGTGTKADIAGYRVGGKTGTAEKISSAGNYNKDAKLASFISVFPVDNPQYLVLVMIDEPKGDKATFGYATGGWIAAPVVGRVIARMGPLLGMKPEYDVPGDDAEKFWTENDKPREARQKAPAPTAASLTLEKKYLHATTY